MNERKKERKKKESKKKSEHKMAFYFLQNNQSADMTFLHSGDNLSTQFWLSTVKKVQIISERQV